VGDDAYTFTFGASQSDYLEYLPTVEKMINSFKFVNISEIPQVTQAKESPTTPTTQNNTERFDQNSEQPNGLTNLQSPQQLTEYTDPRGRFTIYYPASWTISPLSEPNRFEENAREDIAVEFKGAEGSWKSFNIVIKQLTDESTDVKGLTDFTMIDATTRLRGGQVEESTECERYTIQGKQACSFIISSKPNPIIDQKMIMMQVTTLVNGTAYALSYGNTPSEFDRDLPMIEEMIASFTLTGPNLVNESVNSASQNNVTQGPESEIVLETAPDTFASNNETTRTMIGDDAYTEEGLIAGGPQIEGNKSEPMRWLTYNDPILQFTIEYPSTWDINQDEDMVSFQIPDTYSDFDVIVEPLLTLDHSEYARDTLNERRKYSLEIIGLNETSINGQPATMAQYDDAGTMTLSYFMVTDDYTGYRLLYAPDFRDDNSSQRMPMIENMTNSFKITK
jgi:hypothetical protein